MLNKAYKALAHPIRRDILKRLRAGPMHAGAFAPLYDISKPSLSSHFTILKEARLIQPERAVNSARTGWKSYLLSFERNSR